jgi:hypothetical protein
MRRCDWLVIRFQSDGDLLPMKGICYAEEWLSDVVAWVESRWLLMLNNIFSMVPQNAHFPYSQQLCTILGDSRQRQIPALRHDDVEISSCSGLIVKRNPDQRNVLLPGSHNIMKNGRKHINHNPQNSRLFTSSFYSQAHSLRIRRRLLQLLKLTHRNLIPQMSLQQLMRDKPFRRIPLRVHKRNMMINLTNPL